MIKVTWFSRIFCPSDERHPWAQRPRIQEERGTSLLCKAQAKGRVNPCHPVPRSWWPPEGIQGWGGVHIKLLVCRRRSCRRGELNIWIHPPMEGREAPARVVGDRKALCELLVKSVPAHSLPHSYCKPSKLCLKLWLTLEKIKGIKSQGLETYLKSHLYHVALGVFWNPQSAH